MSSNDPVFGALARERVETELLKLDRPATPRELSQALKVSTKHVRTVLRSMLACGEVGRYMPRPGFGRAEAYYYHIQCKRDLDATFAIWRSQERRCAQTATPLLDAFLSVGEISAVALAAKCGCCRENARQFLERQVERGRAVKHKAKPGTIKEKRGYVLYSPVRR